MSTTTNVIWILSRRFSPWRSSETKTSWNGSAPSAMVDASLLHSPTSKMKRSGFRTRAWDTESWRWLRSCSCGPTLGKHRRSSGGLPEKSSFVVSWLKCVNRLGGPGFELGQHERIWSLRNWPIGCERVRLQHDRLALVFGTRLDKYKWFAVIESIVIVLSLFVYSVWANSLRRPAVNIQRNSLSRCIQSNNLAAHPWEWSRHSIYMPQLLVPAWLHM